MSRIACIYFIFLMNIVLSSCNDHYPVAIKKKYIAIKESDTARAILEILPGTFKGTLEINYHGIYKDSGNIKGVVKGDTLIGEFNYQQYRLPAWMRKPLNLLKTKDQFIMGEGRVKYTFGRVHFDPKVPMIYSDTNFVFVAY